MNFDIRKPVVALTALGLAIALTACSSSPEPSSTSSSYTSANSETEIAKLAEAFAETLTDEQRTELFQEYNFESASNWSNFPNALLAGGGRGPQTSSGGRIGLQTSTLSDDQWASLEALLAAVTSSEPNEGLDEILQHLAGDDYLAANGGGSDYGRGQYFIAFLGQPSDTETWQLQFGGHHLALSNTYQGGVLVSATPSFRGMEPMSTVEQDGITVIPEQQEQAAFAALLSSLTADQLAMALSPQAFGDILLGPGNDWAFPLDAEGLKGSELTSDQSDLLLAAINTYVGDLDAASAAEILSKYKAELSETYILFSGSTSMTSEGDYIRIDGPSVWIEFSMQRGIVMSGAHPHAVWRDSVSDYAGLTP